jgi:hypothetical protein
LCSYKAVCQLLKESEAKGLWARGADASARRNQTVYLQLDLDQIAARLLNRSIVD